MIVIEIIDNKMLLL